MPPRKTKPGPEADIPIPEAFRQWFGLKAQSDLVAKRLKALRDRLVTAIERDGYPDEKGSLYIDLPEEIEGFKALKYQRQVNEPVLNDDRAEALLKTKGLLERCTIMIPTLDSEEIYKAHYEGLIDQAELDSIFDHSETFSFRQVKA
jgi:hypothetical protein